MNGLPIAAASDGNYTAPSSGRAPFSFPGGAFGQAVPIGISGKNVDPTGRTQLFNPTDYYTPGSPNNPGPSGGYGGPVLGNDSFSSVGNFATGGGFTIGGDGGVDTTPVMFMGTKGEVVNITHGVPDGVNVPSLGSLGSSSAQSAPIAPVQNKTVYIYVQQGVQADQFIRSRAEVARAAA